MSVVWVGCLVFVSAFGQTTDSSKKDVLLVYGEDFAFGVSEPDSWIGDIDNAKEYYANIIFYKDKEALANGGALIQVYCFGKQDEKTQKDLEYDVQGYRKKYLNLREEDLTTTHKDYKCFSRMMYVENDFYQYTVYVNPGKKFKKGISVAMHISKRPATEEELRIFRSIISSLSMLKG